MDKLMERRIVRKIQVELGRHLIQLGFLHTKSTLYVRLHEQHADVIHLHKYSFQKSFRMHSAIRSFADSFEAISLNGPDSHEWGIETKRRMHFDDGQRDIDKCISDMTLFYEHICEPFFKNAMIATNLLSQNSPEDAQNMDVTMEILGIRISKNEDARRANKLTAKQRK